MKKYFMTKTRDGQGPVRHSELFASNMDEAIAEFSKIILNDIAAGIDYSYISSEEELMEVMGEDYEWQGAGWYINPNVASFGREEFYSRDSKFDRYREDVYNYAIEEDEIED